jgi:hypothetical protein
MDRLCQYIMAVLVGCVISVFLAATILSVNLCLRSFVPVGQVEHCGSIGSVNGPASNEECR